MKSARPKVMHAIAGRPMLGHILAAASQAGSGRLAIVLGPNMNEARDYASKAASEAQFFEQTERKGTAHALLSARDALEDPADDVLVLYGDTPLMTAETLAKVRASLKEGAEIVVLGFRADDPSGYGRLILDDKGTLAAIREDRDATAEEKRIDLCNSGVMAFAGTHLPGLIDEIGNDNAKGEFYLTDAVELGREKGLKLAVIECPEAEVLGVNSRAELARAEALMQERLRAVALDGGVTMTAPETVFLSFDTVLGRDVTIEPNVVFGPRVSVGEGSRIRAFSHIEDAKIAENAEIGPFARLRPGAELDKGAKVGNFVEIKKARVGPGAKVNHLTYIGDAIIGAGANIGAGTITCNYDGFNKYQTVIGENAFIGSNSSLVAPVSIGDGAYIGSGSVITKDVGDGALAIERNQQREVAGWAVKFNAKQGGKKRT
jgi:bifunctional UDP-N-acetylglucosamine pyrophosphorylase/glucosamine-1-phosphate N-acetyltransferase